MSNKNIIRLKKIFLVSILISVANQTLSIGCESLTIRTSLLYSASRQVPLILSSRLNVKFQKPCDLIPFQEPVIKNRMQKPTTPTFMSSSTPLWVFSRKNTPNGFLSTNDMFKKYFSTEAIRKLNRKELSKKAIYKNIDSRPMSLQEMINTVDTSIKQKKITANDVHLIILIMEKNCIPTLSDYDAFLGQYAKLIQEYFKDYEGYKNKSFSMVRSLHDAVSNAYDNFEARLVDMRHSQRINAEPKKEGILDSIAHVRAYVGIIYNDTELLAKL